MNLLVDKTRELTIELVYYSKKLYDAQKNAQYSAAKNDIALYQLKVDEIEIKLEEVYSQINAQFEKRLMS